MGVKIPDYNEDIDLPDPICATCGFPIDEEDQNCPSLDEGVCAP